METALLIIGILLVAGWAGRQKPMAPAIQGAGDLAPGMMPMTPAPQIGNPPQASLVTGEPSGVLNPSIGPVPAGFGTPAFLGPPVPAPAAMPIVFLGPPEPAPNATQQAGQPIMTTSTSQPAVSSSPGFFASGGITPSAGNVDKLIMTSPAGYQIWQRPNGDTYQVWL